jgi:hypothetical protein
VNLLLYLDKPEEALALLVGLTEEDPDNLGDMGRLGIARAKLGDRPEAERVSDALPPLGRPFRMGDPFVWRACISASLGDLERAVVHMDQALREGTRVRLYLHTNPFLGPLRDYEPFQRLMEPNG